MNQPPTTPAQSAALPAKTPAATESGDLGAPLYVAWQITNECNLACLHCIEESGPGKAFRDELTATQVFAVLEQMLGPGGALPVVLRRRADAPSAVLRDGRVRLRARRRAQDRDQRPLPDAGELRAPEGARRQGGAGEPRRRVGGDLQPHARARRVRPSRSTACATCTRRACRSRSTSRRRSSTSTRSARCVDLAYELGAYSFYTGPHDVHRQRGQGLAPPRAVGRAIRRRSSTPCTRRPRSTAAACASTSTRRGCSRSCATGCTIPRRC